MRTLIVTVTMGLAVWIGQVAGAGEGLVSHCDADCGAAVVLGGPHHCARCGCQAACRRYVCNVVCDVKKVTKTCWAVKCEPHCPLRPGCGAFLPQRTCGSCAPEACTPDCGGQQCGCVSCQRCEVPPRCGHVRIRKRLMKKEITVEVPVYRCEVKYLCDECAPEEPAEAESDAHAESTSPAPLPPISQTQSPDWYELPRDDA